MAKETISYNEIPDLNEDWSLDKRNGLPYSGSSVQNFLRSQLSNVMNSIAYHGDSIDQINTTLEEHTESINAKITTDRIEDGAVTSEKLESSIQSLITNISKNASFAGIATPSTNPGTPDGPVFYIATANGTYTNFGSIEVTYDEVVILHYDTTWNKIATGIASDDVQKFLRRQLSNVMNSIAYHGDSIDQINTTLEEHTENINQDITNINQDITNINQDITNINQDITNINQDITNINQDITNINQDITELSKKLNTENENIFSYNNNAEAISRIISPYDEDNNLELSLYVKRKSTFVNNPCLHFIYVALRNTSTGQTTRIHYCADDITPIQMNNTYIGANHGDSDCNLLNIPNHGKTAQDIGSVWKDKNGAKCVLVGVPDENTLWFFGENIYSYPKFRFNSSIFKEGAILTHYSGATHQGDIILSSSGQMKQWFSSIKIKETKVIVDDTVVTESGDYKFKTLKICETYDIMNVASVIETIKNNAGTYTSTPNPNDVIAENVARFTIIYQFEGAGEWRIISNFTAYQDLYLEYYGFTQQSPLDGYISMYIPKTLPIEGIDFRTIVPYTTGVTTKNLTSEYWENPMLPPDRWIQIGQSVSLHSGYLFDYGIGGEKRKDCINNAFFLYNSREIYPHGIDNKLSIKSGDNYSAVVWRSYLPTKDINNNGIIAINVFEFEGACYIYADFNLPSIYEIKIPNEYIGKVVDVFEKSDNITLLTEIASTTILVKMEQSLPGYGYFVAKLVV